MSSRPTRNLRSKQDSAPVIGQVSSQIIPSMDWTHGHEYGFYNEQMNRTPRYAVTTNLFQAICEFNDPEKVSECLKNGADINLQDEKGKTPLMLTRDNPKIYNQLIDHGADVFIQDFKGNTALFYAVRYQKHNLAQKIVERFPTTINSTNPHGQTPLMVLAKEGYLTREDKMVRWLLQHGADPNHKDNNGNTVLTLAILSHLDENIPYGGDTFARSDELIANFINILIEKGGVDMNDPNPLLLMAKKMNLPLTGQVLVDIGSTTTK